MRSISEVQLEHLLPAGPRGDPDVSPSPHGSDGWVHYVSPLKTKCDVQIHLHCALTGNMGIAPLPFFLSLDISVLGSKDTYQIFIHRVVGIADVAGPAAEFNRIFMCRLPLTAECGCSD